MLGVERPVPLWKAVLPYHELAAIIVMGVSSPLVLLQVSERCMLPCASNLHPESPSDGRWFCFPGCPDHSEAPVMIA